MGAHRQLATRADGAAPDEAVRPRHSCGNQGLDPAGQEMGEAVIGSGDIDAIMRDPNHGAGAVTFLASATARTWGSSVPA
jgi:hypothetical protein